MDFYRRVFLSVDNVIIKMFFSSLVNFHPNPNLFQTVINYFCFWCLDWNCNILAWKIWLDIWNIGCNCRCYSWVVFCVYKRKGKKEREEEHKIFLEVITRGRKFLGWSLSPFRNNFLHCFAKLYIFTLLDFPEQFQFNNCKYFTIMNKIGPHLYRK